MSRLSTHLDAIAAWLAARTFGAGPLVTECRRQLDLVDAEDLARISFASPCGFLVLPRAQLVARADGGRDADLTLVLAIAAQARPGSSADAEALDRGLALAAALDDVTFGQVACSAVGEIELRPVLQAGIETKGMAIVAVSFRQRLYRVVDPPLATQELIDAAGLGARGGDPGVVLAEDGSPTPDEQSVIDAWGAP